MPVLVAGSEVRIGNGVDEDAVFGQRALVRVRDTVACLRGDVQDGDGLIHVVDVGMDHVLGTLVFHGLEGHELLARESGSREREFDLDSPAGLLGREGGRCRDLVALIVERRRAVALSMRVPDAVYSLPGTSPVYSITSTMVSSSRAWLSWVPFSASVAVVFMVLGMFSSSKV